MASLLPVSSLQAPKLERELTIKRDSKGRSFEGKPTQNAPKARITAGSGALPEPGIVSGMTAIFEFNCSPENGLAFFAALQPSMCHEEKRPSPLPGCASVTAGM
jgi:hypothetical protein